MARQTNRDIFRTIEHRIQKSQRKYERQGFTVNLPSWFTELQQRASEKGKRFTKKMLGEAEKLAKNFKRTTVPKAERQAEKQRRKEEREIAKMPSKYREYYDQLQDYNVPSFDHDFDDPDDELFHPQYDDDYDDDLLLNESSAVLQEVITALEEMLASGSKTADELLLAIETAIDTEGQRKVAKGIASVGKDLKDALGLMGYIEQKQDYTGAFAFQSKALSLITKGVYGVEELSKVRENNYGL